jgi:Phosphotransferase enzyme family
MPCRYVAEKTTIPIPKVHAYSFLKESPIGMAFVIMDYVEGRTLFDIGILNLSPEQKNGVYEQLADISIQLRQQEFFKIGALALSRARSESGSTFEVCNRPLSVEVNAQELEGLHPTRIFKNQAVYTTARDYVSSLLWLALNEFEEGRNSVLNEEDGRRVLYGLHDFKRYVEETWLDPALNNGPFVLMHGDLGPANILLDENLDLVAVLDWEWSRVVPIQLFIPPTWLTGRLIEGISSHFDREDYLVELAKFRSVVVDREKLHGGRRLLSESWAKLEKECPFLIAAALINPASLYTVYWRFLYWKLHLREKKEDVLDAFMGSSQSYQTLLNRKVREQKEYQEEMKLLGVIGDENE